MDCEYSPVENCWDQNGTCSFFNIFDCTYVWCESFNLTILLNVNPDSLPWSDAIHASLNCPSNCKLLALDWSFAEFRKHDWATVVVRASSVNSLTGHSKLLYVLKSPTRIIFDAVPCLPKQVSHIKIWYTRHQSCDQHITSKQVNSNLYTRQKWYTHKISKHNLLFLHGLKL